MLKRIKGQRFWSYFSGILCLCILRAIYYYVNGQSIASAHMDGHSMPIASNVFVAVILTIIFIVIYIAEKQEWFLKWFLIPVTLVTFALIHFHIASLFACCPEW
ncbi:MAG: hypothetical protein FWE68_02895 [Defluviitaleaceae bacterium]|nr:hypothetical protein [Defluviitaleaceae bacterium]